MKNRLSADSKPLEAQNGITVPKLSVEVSSGHLAYLLGIEREYLKAHELIREIARMRLHGETVLNPETGESEEYLREDTDAQAILNGLIHWARKLH